MTTTSSNGPGVLDRPLPHALDAERALLGSMLLDEGAIGEAIATLRDLGRGVFWLEKHQQLYEQVVGLWNERSPVDAVVIKDVLDRNNMFAALGGYEYLAELISSVPSALRVRHYANIVRNKFLLRQLVDAAHKTMNLAFEQRTPAEQILDDAEKLIFQVTERRVSSSADTLMQEVDELFRRIEAREKHQGEPTGYYKLDEMTSGLHKGELIIIAGRPSMGKTALGLNIAEHMALTANIPVLFFSLEMSRASLAERLLCSRARVNAQKLRKALLDGRDVQRLTDTAGELRNKPLLVDDTAGLTILELRARARIAARRHQIRAVFVDYLQLMHSPGHESRQVEVAEISRGLKALAKDLNIPVIAMAQLNRNTEDRSRNRPRMSDLRESGAIEQDADVIMLLHRESYYKDKARSAEGDGSPPIPDEDDFKAELIVDKQRNGPTGVVTLLFDAPSTRFENFDPTDARRFGNTREAAGGNGAPF